MWKLIRWLKKSSFSVLIELVQYKEPSFHISLLSFRETNIESIVKLFTDIVHTLCKNDRASPRKIKSILTKKKTQWIVKYHTNTMKTTQLHMIMQMIKNRVNWIHWFGENTFFVFKYSGLITLYQIGMANVFPTLNQLKKTTINTKLTKIPKTSNRNIVEIMIINKYKQTIRLIGIGSVEQRPFWCHMSCFGCNTALFD